MTTTTDADLEAPADVDREDRPGEPAVDAVDRDREFARLLVLVGLAWALIWTVIIAALFLFGEPLSGLLV